MPAVTERKLDLAAPLDHGGKAASKVCAILQDAGANFDAGTGSFADVTPAKMQVIMIYVGANFMHARVHL